MKEIFVQDVILPKLIENLGQKTESATTASAASMHDKKDVEMDDMDDVSSVTGSVAQD